MERNLPKCFSWPHHWSVFLGDGKCAKFENLYQCGGQKWCKKENNVFGIEWSSGSGEASDSDRLRNRMLSAGLDSTYTAPHDIIINGVNGAAGGNMHMSAGGGVNTSQMDAEHAEEALLDLAEWLFDIGAQMAMRILSVVLK